MLDFFFEYWQPFRIPTPPKHQARNTEYTVYLSYLEPTSLKVRGKVWDYDAPKEIGLIKSWLPSPWNSQFAPENHGFQEGISKLPVVYFQG